MSFKGLQIGKLHRNSVRNFYTVAFEFLTTLVKKLLDIRKFDIYVKDDMHFTENIYLYVTYNKLYSIFDTFNFP